MKAKNYSTYSFFSLEDISTNRQQRMHIDILHHQFIAVFCATSRQRLHQLTDTATTTAAGSEDSAALGAEIKRRDCVISHHTGTKNIATWAPISSGWQKLTAASRHQTDPLRCAIDTITNCLIPCSAGAHFIISLGYTCQPLTSRRDVRVIASWHHQQSQWRLLGHCRLDCSVLVETYQKHWLAGNRIAIDTHDISVMKRTYFEHLTSRRGLSARIIALSIGFEYSYPHKCKSCESRTCFAVNVEFLPHTNSNCYWQSWVVKWCAK